MASADLLEMCGERATCGYREHGHAILIALAYVGWIRRFILFHGKRDPAEMGALLDQVRDAPARDGPCREN